MVSRVILAPVGENLPLAFRDIQDGRQDGCHGYWVYKKTDRDTIYVSRYRFLTMPDHTNEAIEIEILCTGDQ